MRIIRRKEKKREKISCECYAKWVCERKNFLFLTFFPCLLVAVYEGASLRCVDWKENHIDKMSVLLN